MKRCSRLRKIAACVAPVVAAWISPAMAQSPVEPAADAARGSNGVPVTLDRVDYLHVTPRGQMAAPHPGGSFGPRACSGVASHTNANFGGGSFVVQAGFAQGELSAATYTLSPSSFPIKIDLVEVIVATSNATQPTTTQWSLLFYQGTPTSGTLVFSASSDNELLPHIEIPAGTNGVNLQFSVDPGDPDQIIIDNNGSNQFTVAFRIDRHNQPPVNPCTTSPPTCCNAFPTTDVGGLASPSGNWLFGLNCGPLGCPSNGGWARFSELTSFCRPSGDWVMRTSWSTVNCVPVTGACCLPNGSCTEVSSSDCTAQGGTYQGDNTTCGQTNCPQPTGACCLPDGTCQVLTQAQCTGRGGTYQGTGTSCAGRNCPQPMGACCFSNGFCLNLTEANCRGANGTWLGAGTSCAPNNACPTGACCLPDGSCQTGLTQGQCTGQGGTFRGVGSSCVGADCPQPSGACCLSNGFCLELTQSNCAGIQGSWAGALTTCADGNGNGRADSCEVSCPADFNGDGFADFFDFDDFVTCFEGGACPPGQDADFNNDGFADFFDYDDFVSAFEIGC